MGDKRLLDDVPQLSAKPVLERQRESVLFYSLFPQVNSFEPRTAINIYFDILISKVR